MRLHATEELKLPQRRAWAEVTNFGGFEKLLRDRGAELERSAEPQPPGLGTRWQGSFEYSGKRREITAEVTRYEPPHALHLQLTSAGLDGEFAVTLTEGKGGRTHIDVGLDLAARTMRARIFLQPLKLAHATLQARFATRLGKLARAMEKRRPRA
ncbi:MAG: Polyketide cyclase / dehydrase and lipid transport [Rhodobacteraceae bacterium HLUCCA09]|nr:MAG: Polyketide cyclase / dehydrase and lipid transport [Rhodobacteraceae bacterium HLUCCA09]